MTMDKVYRFTVDCGRCNYLQGTFVADDAKVAHAIGKTVYFSEPWGKHSGAEVTIEAGHFKVLTDDQDFIAKLRKYGMGHHGDDPLGILAASEASQEDDANT